MGSLEHPRRQAQHLDIKALTSSWIRPANVDFDVKGFKVYNQIAVPYTQKLAVCMECFESHSQNLECQRVHGRLILGLLEVTAAT